MVNLSSHILLGFLRCYQTLLGNPWSAWVFLMIFQQAMFGNGSTYWSNKSLPPKGVSRFISVSTYIYIYIYMVCHQNSKGVLMQAVESDVNPGIDPLAVYLGLVPGFGLISFHYWNGRKQVGFHQGLPPSPHPSTPSFLGYVYTTYV